MADERMEVRCATLVHLSELGSTCTLQAETLTNGSPGSFHGALVETIEKDEEGAGNGVTTDHLLHQNATPSLQFS